jgi:hypothetical protein
MSQDLSAAANKKMPPKTPRSTSVSPRASQNKSRNTEESLNSLTSRGNEVPASGSSVIESSSSSSASTGSTDTNTGFTQLQMQQLMAMMSQFMGQHMLHGSNPTSGAVSAVTRASSSATLSPAPPTSLSTSSAASYSSVVAAQAQNPSTTVINSTFGLYGNQDKVSATLPALKQLPKNADYDNFEEWRRVAVNDMVNTGGMDQVVTKSHAESLNLAIRLETTGRPPHVVENLWKTLHLKACSVLKTAFRPALKDTPETEARLEQTRYPDQFIEGNANWLWQYAIKQFVPDHIGKITRAIKALESLQFVPKKTTPSEYLTSFREAINEIRAADPDQQFTVKYLLAAYLKGWPAELNQQLNMVKAMSNPTVDDAQRHLQQWYNDNGKGKPKPANPNPPQVPSGSPSAPTIAALKHAADKARKHFEKANKQFKHAQKSDGRSDKQNSNKDGDSGSSKSDSDFSLGALTEQKLTSPNQFSALFDETGKEDDADGESPSLAAVSPDGIETVNKRNEFLLDSGASRSVVYDHSLLRDPQALHQPVILNCAMGKATVLKESGSVNLNSRVKLNNVCHAKGATLNAMSVSKISDTGFYSIFGSKKAIVVKKSALEYAIRRLKPEDVALEVPRVGDIYVYTRSGTESSSSNHPPEISVQRPKGSIPKKGELKPTGGSSQNYKKKTGQAPTASSSTSSSTAKSTLPSAPSTRSRTNTAGPSSLASAINAALVATLEAHGLPPDTPVDLATWCALSETRASRS